MPRLEPEVQQHKASELTLKLAALMKDYDPEVAAFALGWVGGFYVAHHPEVQGPLHQGLEQGFERAQGPDKA